jgi:hypothetical protein
VARHESSSRQAVSTESSTLADELDPAQPWPGPPDQHPALVAFRLKTRRSLTVYAAAVLVALLVVGIAVKEVYAHGELTHVSQQSGTAPAAVPSASTAAKVTRVWQSSDLAAGGDPFADGVVVTYSPHTVNGRDALTGAVLWHYTRTDRTLCGVVQQDSSTIAVYEHDGNCDEVTGFTTATGEPKFYRTLMDDGPVGISSAPNVVMTVAAGDVHVFDNAGGLDRWFWTPPDGCVVQRALAGSKGVLIGYHCSNGYHLALHSLLQDQALVWTVDSSHQLIPLAAGAAIEAADPDTGLMTRYSAGKGVASAPTALAASGTLGPVQAALRALPSSQSTIETSDDQNAAFEVVDVGALIGLSAKDSRTWTASAGSPLGSVADAGNGLVAIAAGSVITQREVIRGSVKSTTTVSGPIPTGALKAYPVGDGLLLAGASTGLYS